MFYLHGLQHKASAGMPDMCTDPMCCLRAHMLSR